MNHDASSTFTDMDASAFAVSDYLQLAAMSMRSILMELSRDGVTVGEICVLRGEVHAAHDEHGAGVSAFSRLAFDESVRVNCVPVGEVPPAKNIEGRVEQLLLNAARVSDEQVRDDDPDDDPDDEMQIIELSDRRPPPPPAPVPPPPPPLRSAALRPPPLPAPRPKREQVSMGNERHPQPSSPPRAAVVPTDARPLQELLTTAHGLRGAIISSYDGQLLTQAGAIEGETAAAVIATALQIIWQTCEEIGFGAPRNWSLTIGDDSWYVCHREREVVVVVGAAVDNPEATMRKLALVLGGGGS